MNSETRGLTLSELDKATGGGAVEVGAAVLEIIDFMASHHGIADSINYIKQQAGK
jgi:hypothetical protein